MIGKKGASSEIMEMSLAMQSGSKAEQKEQYRYRYDTTVLHRTALTALTALYNNRLSRLFAMV